MSEYVTIALDAMGGDFAPQAVIDGAAKIAEQRSDIFFKIYGDEEKIKPLIANHNALKSCSFVIHTTSVIGAADKVTHAIHHGKESSMWLAIQAHKNGEADAVVSSGNTGALMAISKILLKTIPGVDRPAITTLLPNSSGKIAMLDLGANVDCNSENLLQFALMGNAYAKIVLNISQPKIGLLNIGSEDVKGNDVVRAALSLIKEQASHLNFIGFVEGNDICSGSMDVVVTDGFTGNIALKTVEGTAKMMKSLIKEVISSSFLAKLALLLIKPSLKKINSRIDPRLYNGAMFLGLNGIVVKSHGWADAISFESAINVAISLVEGKINEQINQELQNPANAA